MRVFGIVLIVIGLAMLIIRGFSYTQKEKVVDLGPLEVNREEHKTVSWPFYAGGVAVVAGVVFLLAGKKKVTS